MKGGSEAAPRAAKGKFAAWRLGFPRMEKSFDHEF
jgi:hypothetical protein